MSSSGVLSDTAVATADDEDERPADVACTFRPDAAEVAQARHFVQHVLGDPVGAQQASEVVLMASELAANAVRYGRGPFTVTVQRRRPGGVRVAVSHADGGRSVPHLVPPGARHIGGLGLHIIDRLAARWGTDRRPGGRVRVWFEHDTQPQACR